MWRLGTILVLLSVVGFSNGTVGPILRTSHRRWSTLGEELIPDFEMDLPPKTLEDEALEVTSPPFSVKASELEPTFEMGEEDEVLLFGTQNLNPTLAQRLLENKLGINPNAETTTKKLMEEIHTEPMEVLVATTTTEIPASASTTIRPPPISCKQKNCQKLSSYLSSSMDWDKDPCDNFQGFMCGNWLERFEVPKFTPSWGFMEQQQYLIHKVSALLLRTNQNEDWDLFRTAKKAFQSCMDVDAIERNGYKLWKEEVEDEINGFPMAEDFWRQGTFDPNKMIATTLRLVGSNPLMNIRVEERSDLPNKIHIDLANIGLPKSVLNDHEGNLQTFGAYVRLMYNVARQLHEDEEKYEQIKLGSDFGEDMATEERLVLDVTDNVRSDQIYTLPKLPNAKRLIANGSVIAVEPQPQETEAQRRKRGIFDLLPRVDERTASTMEYQIIAEQVQHLAEFKIDLGKMKSIFVSPNEDIPFSKLESLAFSDDGTPLKTFLPHYMGKDQFQYAKIDFEALLRQVFQDVEGFNPYDYVYVVNSKQIDGIQKVYTHHDRKTIANLIGFHTFLQVIDHMPEVYRNLGLEFKRVTLGVDELVDRDAVCGQMIVEYLPLVIAHLMFNKGADRRHSWELSKMETVIHDYLKNQGVETKSDKFPEWLMNRTAVDVFYQGIRSEDIHMDTHLKNWVHLSSWKSQRELMKLERSNPGVDWQADSLLKVQDLALVSTDIFPHFLLKHPLIDHQGPVFANIAGLGWIVYQRQLNQHWRENQTLARDVIGDLLDIHDLWPKRSSTRQILPGFESFSGRQMLLMWMGRVWGCGGSTAMPSFRSQDDFARASLFHQLAPRVEDQFMCGKSRISDATTDYDRLSSVYK